ncbi:MAG: hypothetical protein AB1847_13180 [bacterium]
MIITKNQTSIYRTRRHRAARRRAMRHCDRKHRTVNIVVRSFFILFILFALIWFAACSQTPSGQEDGPVELSLRQRVSGTISRPGEVDWYHIRAVEANSILKVNCSSNTYRSDEELLVTVYQMNGDGSWVRLLAEHAPEGSEVPPDITMNISIDTPKNIYISVRDLMDDESSNNPYYLTIDYAQGPEGNENFSQATPLAVDDPQSCQIDCIGSIGDIDCYRFTATEDGVYAIRVDFSPFSDGTPVELSLDLYDSQGNLTESLRHGQGNAYHLLACLGAGDYYVLIKDYGMDDFDSASTYQICLETGAADEQGVNDTRPGASPMEYDNASLTFSAHGSIDYMEDQDWYGFSLKDIPAKGCKVLAISFDDEGQGLPFTYQLALEVASGDEGGNDAGDGDGAQDGVSGASGGRVLLSHTYRGGSSPYRNEIKAGEEDYYLVIQAAQDQIITQGAPYRVYLTVLDVADPAEDAVKSIDPNTGTPAAVGNDTIDTADLLVSDSPVTAMIGYRGDEDWYRIEVEDTDSPKVLEVFLDTNSQPSSVNYSLSVMRDEVVGRAVDRSGENGPCELKMGLLIPESGSVPITPASYFFRVCDYQADNGDGLTPYRIQANIREIPKTLPADPAIDQNRVIYYSETREIGDNTTTSIKLEYTSLIKTEYKVNTALFDFHDQNRVSDSTQAAGDPNLTAGMSADIIMEKDGDQTTISFPWIAGYIDYQGDQDWFEIDLGPLADANQPADSSWYYDISIDMHAGAPGSSVEYIWKLYRDRNQNGIMVDRPRDSDGFMASAGDLGTEIQPFDVTTPAEGTDQKFWVGDAWKGKFYLSISDFNYVNSAHPDDDWGYTGAPYYVRVTLKYHKGQSYP